VPSNNREAHEALYRWRLARHGTLRPSAHSSLAEKSMPYATVNDKLFDREITLRDAYRIMERFVANYASRGDTAVSDFLHTYAGEVSSGQSTDPAALYDFMTAAQDVLDKD
jgi:predicted signal transduction protein with EAL and GGDEF domain